MWFKKRNVGEPLTSILMNWVFPHGAQSGPNDKDAVDCWANKQLVTHALEMNLGLIPFDLTDSL